MKIHYKGFMRERIQRNPITVSPETTFHEARSIIHKNRVRNLPVVDKDNVLVGLVTYGDIQKAAPSDATMLSTLELDYLLEKLKVSKFMTPRSKLITITPDTIIEDAVQLMHDNKIGCLPVLEEEKLYGIFTETEALYFLVDIFGLKQRGTRLTIAIDDKPGSILGILEVIKKHNLVVISIVTPAFMVEGKRLVVIRVRTEEYNDLVSDMEKAGYPVLSIGKWPSI
jgi:acetoin utilization protein AcuB